MEHLSLEIFDLTGTGSKYAALPEDTVITITDTSEIFASGDVWSHQFKLNVRANAHIFGTAGDMHGSRLHEQINRRRARLWAAGIPLYYGYLRLEDEADVDEDGNVDISFESGQKTFEELIEGAKANQVPLMGDVRIGLAAWRKRDVECPVRLTAQAVLKDGSTTNPCDVTDGGSSTIIFRNDSDNIPVQQYPRLVMPKGSFRRYGTAEEVSIDCVNTDYPYTEDANGTPTHPYCNVALCYQKYDYKKTDKDGREELNWSEEPEAQRGYEVMPANRVNSAPNFFVIYWIRALMKHLGIYIEENQMMDVEDLRRLFFVNTGCPYEEPKRKFEGGRWNWYRYAGRGRLIAERFDLKKNIHPEDSNFVITGYEAGPPQYDYHLEPGEIPELDYVTVQISEVDDRGEEGFKQTYENNNSYFHDAWATSECFPDVEVSEVIEAVESGFGVRFLFGDDYRRVRIVLLRNLFNSQEIQDVRCDILEDSKVENAIRGFRITYGNTEDTQFYYKGFADKLPHMKTLWPDLSDKHDYSNWDLDARYEDIMKKVSAFDKTCYVTPDTGNAYIIKIDKDAKRYRELYPSLFEAAGYMDAEDGDCSGEEDTIETVNIGFTPAIMNDVGYVKERTAKKDDERQQEFALFVDETMRVRRLDLEDLEAPKTYNDPDVVYDTDKLYQMAQNEGKWTADDGNVKPGEFAITSDMYAMKENLKSDIRFIKSVWRWQGDRLVNVMVPVTWEVTLGIDGYLNEGYRLYLQDNYEPNDDGVCPIEKHDWGLTLGIMRGSGSDAHVEAYPDEDDREQNATWELVPGSSATAHPDTCDNYGNEWDYNGESGWSIKVRTSAEAVAQLYTLFPNTNAPFDDNGDGYITGVRIVTFADGMQIGHSVLFVTSRSDSDEEYLTDDYIAYLRKQPFESIMAKDAMDLGLIVEADSSEERGKTLVDLCRKAFGSYPGEMIIDNGVGSRYGRFSLKPRAEKPNPKYDPTKKPGEQTEPQYLEIDDENLRRRGLRDQFYREYSHWKRNARIAKRKVRIPIAELMAIDKTKKVRVGDIIGFIRKRQFSVSKKTGMGEVTMEIMYL